jgi:hypothetical protein
MSNKLATHVGFLARKINTVHLTGSAVAFFLSEFQVWRITKLNIDEWQLEKNKDWSGGKE